MEEVTTASTSLLNRTVGEPRRKTQTHFMIKNQDSAFVKTVTCKETSVDKENSKKL